MKMTGAEILLRTLLKSGLDVCFANPGTSEMQFLAALDRVDGMRCIPVLFEGVATGAADGFYRVARRPASTLLHLGPGLGNGMANLHNAKKARSGILNIVGQHGLEHMKYETPLAMDVETLAGTFSHWVHTIQSAGEVSRDTCAALQAAGQTPAQIATLLLPADVAWSEVTPEFQIKSGPQAEAYCSADVENAARVIADHGASVLVLVGNDALAPEVLAQLAPACSKYGSRLIAECASAITHRGQGRIAVSRLPYVVDNALGFLQKFDHIILIDAAEPTAFFAYPDKPSLLKRPGTTVHRLVGAGQDVAGAAGALARALNVEPLGSVPVQPVRRSEEPRGALTATTIASVIAQHIPENSIIVDESLTAGSYLYKSTVNAPAHAWMQNTGGAIGFALPAALGAAEAQPESRILALSGDGSAAYTLQSLWTNARMGHKVTTVIFANHSYEILKGEYFKVGAGAPAGTTKKILNIGNPKMNWAGLAGDFGVPGTKVSTAEEFAAALESSYASGGPSLIEVEVA